MLMNVPDEKAYPEYLGIGYTYIGIGGASGSASGIEFFVPEHIAQEYEDKKPPKPQMGFSRPD
jgi:hypothetical protein